MLTLVNTNRMTPPIAPVGLDYIAGVARRAGVAVELIDLCLTDSPVTTLRSYFASARPELIGLSFRNTDDCFWPSGQSFTGELRQTIEVLRLVTDAPIVLGGVGFSIFARQLVQQSGADFGIRGDGEWAILQLIEQLRGGRDFDRVDGLIYRHGGKLLANSPAWPEDVALPVARDTVDNATYFRRGGQIGLETKRGCARRCIYCADPVAKGPLFRMRDPQEIADEFEALAKQGVDVLHLCDAEFNLPPQHARAVCDELNRRRLGKRVRWYAYMAVVPFDTVLARAMAKAGCVGINFTSDSANPDMLATYRQPHRAKDLAEAVDLCREHGIAVMLDMLLGGPGETPETVAETIETFKRIDPDCAGAALGVRVYPDTGMHRRLLRSEVPMEQNPGIRRRYDGPIDLLRPTFYISPELGQQPATLVRELIGDDPRFFPPEADDPTGAAEDHNYNDNRELCEAIEAGARGAYWDILRKIRETSGKEPAE